MEKIFINQSSHPIAYEQNMDAEIKLDELLKSKQNTLEWLFNDDHLFLDNTDSCVNIQPVNNDSYYSDDSITGEHIDDLNKFIRENITFDGDIIVYIGEDIYYK